MPPDTLTSADAAKEPPVLDTLKRFLPYLWPVGHTGHKVRIVGAGLIVLASKGVQLSMGFLYGAAIDKMVPGMEEGVALAIGLVLAYAGARFAGLCCATNATPVPICSVVVTAAAAVRATYGSSMRLYHSSSGSPVGAGVCRDVGMCVCWGTQRL